MQRWIVLVWVLAAGVYAAQQAKGSPAERTAEAQRAVARLEQEWVTALNGGDVPAIGDVLAPDFVRPAPQAGAFIRKAPLMAYYRKALSPHSPLHRRLEGMTIRIYGPAAVARGFVVVTDSATHSTSKLIFTDVFVERGGMWQAVSAQENAVK